MARRPVELSQALGCSTCASDLTWRAEVSMPGSVLGNVVKRVEDPELLVGVGKYVDDMPVEGVLFAAFTRSPYPQALIHSIDVTRAQAMPGVVAVYTGADVGVHSIPPPFGGRCTRQRSVPHLLRRVARYASEPVVIVIAQTPRRGRGRDRGRRHRLGADSGRHRHREGDRSRRPLQFPRDRHESRHRVSGHAGPDPLDGADVVVRARFENQRVAVAPMEGNAIAVIPGERRGRNELTIYVATQMPHRIRDAIGKVFGLDAAAIHVITPNVGGAFGGKIGLPASTRPLSPRRSLSNRPVKWFEGRSENLVGMHGRSQVQYGELGFKQRRHDRRAEGPGDR